MGLDQCRSRAVSRAVEEPVCKFLQIFGQVKHVSLHLCRCTQVLSHIHACMKFKPWNGLTTLKPIALAQTSDEA